MPASLRACLVCNPVAWANSFRAFALPALLPNAPTCPTVTFQTATVHNLTSCDPCHTQYCDVGEHMVGSCTPATTPPRVACPTGTYEDIGDQRHVVRAMHWAMCSAGLFLDGMRNTTASPTCTAQCAPGSFKAGANTITSCSPCAAGTFQPLSGASSCTSVSSDPNALHGHC